MCGFVGLFLVTDGVCVCVQCTKEWLLKSRISKKKWMYIVQKHRIQITCDEYSFELRLFFEEKVKLNNSVLTADECVASQVSPWINIPLIKHHAFKKVFMLLK